MSESCGIARPTACRSMLRPPAVNRKSHSFNAADRNKIKDVPNQSNYGTSGRVQKTVSSNGAKNSSIAAPTGLRSSSLNAKHNFTIKQTQSTTVQNAKKLPKSSNKIIGKSGLIKPSDKTSNQSNGNGISKPISNGKQRLVKMKKPQSAAEKQSLQVNDKASSRSTKSVPPADVKRDTRLKPPSRLGGKSKIASPSNTLTKRNTQNSKIEPQNTVTNGVKSTSVLGKLKKLGSPSTTNTIPNNNTDGITLKQATPVKSPSQEINGKKNIGSLKKDKKIPAPKNAPASRLMYKSSPSKNSAKQNNGIKSTLQRAFGNKVDSDKENDQRPEISAPIGEPKGLPKYKEPPLELSQKVNQDNINNNNTTVNGKHRLVKIDVNNLLVEPYETSITKLQELSLSQESDTEDDSSLSLSNSVENKTKFLRQSNDAPLSPRPLHLGVRNVQLPKSTDERSSGKIATVAPFCRQISKDKVPTPSPTDEKTVEISELDTDDHKSDTINANSKRSSINVNSNASDEERRKTAQGIADLRQNLEQTMSNLRSTQLRNRLSDDFDRRISAQLDADLEEIGALPEVPPPLPSSTAVYRTSTNTITNGFQTLQHSRSPKLHAGESMTTDSFTSPKPPNKYSSLQRIRPKEKQAWKDLSAKFEVDKLSLKSDPLIPDDLSSVSSGDISEYIEGMSTDDFSSANNSPFHSSTTPRGKPNLPLSEALHNKVMMNLRVEIEKPNHDSSETKSESKSSLWKKSKKPEKTDKKKDKKVANNHGSPAVGTRLAMIERSESPCNGAAPLEKTTYSNSSFDCRGGLAYRSLPRPRKSIMTYQESKSTRSSKCGSFEDLIEEEKEISKDDISNKSSNNFVRSPSLKILLRSKAKKKKLQEQSFNENNVTSIQEKTDYISQSICDGSSDIETYTAKKYRSLSAVGNDLLSNTQSLPRHFSAKTYRGNTTWSAPRNNPNSAYSLPVTPGSDCNGADNGLTMYNSSYSKLDPSIGSFTNLTVPDYHNFSDALNSSYQPRYGLEDSESLSSNPDTKKCFKRDPKGKDYRYASSTTDLISLSFKPNCSASALKPHRKSYSAAEADAKSIETATTFLYSLAQNKAAEHANMVKEFESSLSHLTNRLRELTETAEQKDKELDILKCKLQKFNVVSADASPETEWKDSVSNLRKKPSCTSLCSINSQTSISSSIGSTDDSLKKKKKNWIRSSFRSAFGKNKSRSSLTEGMISPSKTDSRNPSTDSNEPETVQTLKEQLRQKEKKLTDIRLEALTSQHQLQFLQDTMAKMRSEMEKLKRENETLQRIGLSSYPFSTLKKPRKQSLDVPTITTTDTEMNIQIKVSIPHYGQNSFEYTTITTAELSVSVTWAALDAKILELFVGYCHTIDPSGSLGLKEDSVYSYVVGDFEQKLGYSANENPPGKFFTQDNKCIEIKLKDGRSNCVDALAFELLMDKGIVDEYVEMLLRHRRIVISGATGTGKSLLANRLAGYVAGRKSEGSNGKVVHLDAKQKGASELRDFLRNLTESFRNNSNSEDTTVIVVDNIPDAEVLQGLFYPLFSKSKSLNQNVYLICILPQCNENLLQVNDDFRWIIFSNNSPPVQTQLTRKLRRSYIENQIDCNQIADELLSIVILWLPKCWQHVNNCLEPYGDYDVTIGPRMFSACPMSAPSSRVWFTDVWNYNVVPYISSVLKQYMIRVQTSAKEMASKFKDPTLWVRETMPWDDVDLLNVNVSEIILSPSDSDVSMTSPSATSSSSDPLVNMLMRLQEAANYDSDTSSSQDGQPLDQALSTLR